MVNVSEEDLKGLVQQGIRGNASGFALLCRRLVSKLKKTSPDVAAGLIELLANDAGTRSMVTQATPVDNESRRALLQVNQHVLLEVEPVWSKEIESALTKILVERAAVEKLVAAGLEPMRAVLFKGPPGVGKTLAAQWLAQRLRLPLLTLDLATVMSSLLGKTGSNIKSVVEYAKGFPCVLLLDEFDSVAKKRDDDRDVGELKRLVTVLLQAIDDWPSTSLLVAATNHAEMLDPAVWRRFDLILDFGCPDPANISDFLRREGASKPLAAILGSALSGATYADLRKLATAARKAAVLEDRVFDDALREGAAAVMSEYRKGGDPMAARIMALRLEGHSQRKIAELVGVSHPTVGKILKSIQGDERD